jgi:predicted nucleic acid-binding protein
MRVQLHEAGRRVGVNDLWIASVAASRHLPVVTQDDDFDVLAELGLLDVVHV